MRAELEGEVRTREHRDNRLSLDSQEVAMLREKEHQLRAEVARLLAHTEKQAERLKSSQERLAGEQHLVTSQDLKLSTQKSRIAELEGSLVLASEQSSALRRAGLGQGEKAESLRKEVEQGRREAAGLAARLAECQASLAEAERRVATLGAAQAQRWEEFCRMADSMKNLSSDMLSQGQANRTIGGHQPL